MIDFNDFNDQMDILARTFNCKHPDPDAELFVFDICKGWPLPHFLAVIKVIRNAHNTARFPFPFEFQQAHRDVMTACPPTQEHSPIPRRDKAWMLATRRAILDNVPKCFDDSASLEWVRKVTRAVELNSALPLKDLDILHDVPKI